MSRYRPHQLPKTHHWGIWDRNQRRFLLGVIAEDFAAADSLAFLLNHEFAKWVGSIPQAYRGTVPAPPDPSAVVVRAVFRKGGAGFSISNDPIPNQPVRAKRFDLSDYARKAPESERRLIARLRAAN